MEIWHLRYVSRGSMLAWPSRFLKLTKRTTFCDSSFAFPPSEATPFSPLPFAFPPSGASSGAIALSNISYWNLQVFNIPRALVYIPVLICEKSGVMCRAEIWWLAQCFSHPRCWSTQYSGPRTMLLFFLLFAALPRSPLFVSSFFGFNTASMTCCNKDLAKVHRRREAGNGTDASHLNPLHISVRNE